MGLLSELRRRNVHRMAALYLVAAWLIMQVTEVLMALVRLPTATGAVILILLAMGFPIALIISWIYELTPEGLTLEKDVKPGESITQVTRRRLDFIVIALLCAAVIVFAYDKWGISGPPITSLAVLPLDNLSVDPQQRYFADGMTDVLTTELAQINGLRVTSRTSAMRFENSKKSLPEIARELKVDAIIEGSVQADDDDIRLTLQLVDGRTDRHLWSKSYHRDLQDVLTLQGEIAHTIAEEVQITLTPRSAARLARERTADAAALRLWVIGNYHLKSYSFDKALQAFSEASSRDPDFAEAYAGIAQAYTYIGGWYASGNPATVLPLARSAAEQAIRLDPELAEAHFALGEIHKFEWNWEAAEQEFRIGAEMNPSDTTGLWLYVNFLGSMGRFDEAIEIGMRVIELDSFSPTAHTGLGQALLYAGRREDAHKQYEKALRLEPDLFWTHFLLAEFHIGNGEYHKATPYLEKLEQKLEATPPSILGLFGYLYTIAGRPEDANAILANLLDRRETEFVPASALAYIYAGLKDYESALTWLKLAYEERNYQLTWLNEDYFWDNLRDDPRFQDILARMDFPDP